MALLLLFWTGTISPPRKIACGSFTLDQQTAFYERVIAEKDAIIKKQDKELTELRKQFMDSLQERIKGA